MDTFRDFIRPQMEEFRRTDGSKTCAICYASLPVAHHIDHANHLRQLVTEYIEQYGPREPDDEFVFYAGWIDYHRKHARLRRTCVECNLTRKRWKRNAPTCAICNEMEHLTDGICKGCENRYT
jgi:hypothetical protein